MNICTKLELENYININKTYFSIDRFEENFAVCEDKLTNKIINISKELLPNSAKPGDILKFENLELIIDLNETQKEQDNIKKLVNTLFKRKE